MVVHRSKTSWYIGISEDKWWHHEACVEVKQGHEDIGIVGCTREELDGFAPQVCIYSRGDLVINSVTIYKMWLVSLVVSYHPNFISIYRLRQVLKEKEIERERERELGTSCSNFFTF